MPHTAKLPTIPDQDKIPAIAKRSLLEGTRSLPILLFSPLKNKICIRTDML
jgi:hypothetical protein